MTIRSEIEAPLAVWAAANQIPVAYENVPFIKPDNGRYLEIYLLESSVINRDVTAMGKRITGRFQVNCYSPVNEGMGAVEALAEGVINSYPVLPKVGTVSIEAPLNASSGIVMDGCICLPITGRYRVEL